MNFKSLGFLLLSLVLATAAGYANWSYLVAARSAPGYVEDQVELRRVVVARSELNVSSPMNSLMLSVVEWPDDLAPSGTFPEIDQVVKRIPRRHFAPGEPLLESGLFAQGALGGLSPLIETGLRAMSVQVDEVIGIAGFVSVGSRVDVLATLRRTIESEAFSQVILQDVQVLAVNRVLDPRRTEPDERVNVVTLEVTPTQAKKLAFAASQGSIQLALRNPHDQQLAISESIGTPNLKGQKKSVDESLYEVIIYRGLNQSSETFSVPTRASANTSAATPPLTYARAGIDSSVSNPATRED
jgi:pilus assembly protein CpaB